MRRLNHLPLLILLLLIGGIVDTYAQKSNPADLVRELYVAHDAGRGPFGQTTDRARIDKFFTPGIAARIWKDANNASGEVGSIDGDPLYNAQDMEIKNFKIGMAVIKGTGATVPVSFTNFKKKQQITYVLKKAGQDWRIDDIRYSKSDSLSKWLKGTGK